MYNQPIVKKNASKLAADAQAFIDSVKQFSTPERAEKYGSPSKEVETPKPVQFFPTFEKRDSSSSLSTEKFSWPKLIVSDFRKEAITFIEIFYFSHKSLPNLSDFVNKFPPAVLPQGPADWEDFLLSIQEPLQNRGIPAYEVPLDYLEPNFVLAVNLIVNAYDKRAIPAKLKEAGLTTKQWSGFLRQDRHYNYYKKRLDAIFDEDMVAESKLAIMRLIQANDLQAVKYYNELQNIYRPQESNQVQLVLMAIMEILTLHVPPDVIGKVAESLRESPQLKAIEV